MALLVAPLTLAVAAAAKTPTAKPKRVTLTVPMAAVCATGPYAQLCPRIGSKPTTLASIKVGKPAVTVTYETAKIHCSQVSLIIYVGGKRAGETAPLGPGGKGSVTVHVPADHHRHRLAWRAQGFVGGCNVGDLQSVSGKIVVRYAPAQP